MGRTLCASAGRSAPVLQFLRRHEEEEAQHLKQFERLLGTSSHGKTALPRMPSQWRVLAVHLYGYEVLGLEFARLLVSLRPDLISILEDEEVHVDFFEQEVRAILIHEGTAADGARKAAQAWRRRLPRTVDRYLHDETLAPFRDELRQHILDVIDARFLALGLLARTEEEGVSTVKAAIREAGAFSVVESMVKPDSHEA